MDPWFVTQKIKETMLLFCFKVDKSNDLCFYPFIGTDAAFLGQKI